MADSANVQKPLRVLVSEGNSTSAREAVTILGLSGHLVEVCDPSPWCLARFSRFVQKFHRCPGLRDDPAGFLRFVEDLLAARHFDVLLPIHEQGFLFARAQERLGRRAGLALPGFVSYRAAHSKVGFSRLLDQLGLPQPVTRIVKSADELRHVVRFPAVVKTSVGTASRGIWFVRSEADLEDALQELSAPDLSADGAFADEVLVQEWIAGTTEKAQAVFCRSKLIGFHVYRQIAAGVGGGEAIKQSVSRPQQRAYLATIGEKLAWHGALSVDYVLCDDSETPLLIDCNPRLVEPMNAYLAAKPRGRPDPPRDAGPAGMCVARRQAAGYLVRMLAFVDRRRTIRRQRRGADTRAAGLDQRGAAGDDRDTPAARSEAGDQAGARRLGRASARSQKHQSDRERGFPLEQHHNG
jgi:hypothetical protein